MSLEYDHSGVLLSFNLGLYVSKLQNTGADN